MTKESFRFSEKWLSLIWHKTPLKDEAMVWKVQYSKMQEEKKITV